jgi:hypothetical protein
MGGAEFTVLAGLLRFVYRRREFDDNFGLGLRQSTGRGSSWPQPVWTDG